MTDTKASCIRGLVDTTPASATTKFRVMTTVPQYQTSARQRLSRKLTLSRNSGFESCAGATTVAQVVKLYHPTTYRVIPIAIAPSAFLCSSSPQITSLYLANV